MIHCVTYHGCARSRSNVLQILTQHALVVPVSGGRRSLFLHEGDEEVLKQVVQILLNVRLHEQREPLVVNWLKIQGKILYYINDKF